MKPQEVMTGVLEELSKEPRSSLKRKRMKALRRKIETGHTIAISACKLHAALQLPGCHMFMCFTIMCIVMSWWAHLPEKMKLNNRAKRIGVNL